MTLIDGTNNSRPVWGRISWLRWRSVYPTATDTTGASGNLPRCAPGVAATVSLLPRRFPYGIYYRVYADRVEVIAVQHSRRDPADWQSRV